MYQSEIFPIRVRAKGTSIATVSNWTWNAIISKIAPLILEEISFYTYLVCFFLSLFIIIFYIIIYFFANLIMQIFGGFSVAMAIFAYFFVPETMGRSLEEIDAVFSEKAGKKKSNTTMA